MIKLVLSGVRSMYSNTKTQNCAEDMNKMRPPNQHTHCANITREVTSLFFSIMLWQIECKLQHDKFWLNGRVEYIVPCKSLSLASHA